MCLLVYPENEEQVSILTQLLKDMNIAYESPKDREVKNNSDYEKVLDERLAQYQNAPTEMMSYDEAKKRIKAKYGA